MLNTNQSWKLLQNKLRELEESKNKFKKKNLLRDLFKTKFNSQYLLDNSNRIVYLNGWMRRHGFQEICTLVLIEELKIFSRDSLEEVLKILNFNINNYFRRILLNNSNRDKNLEIYLANLLETYDLNYLNYTKNLLAARLLCLISPQKSKNLLNSAHSYIDYEQILNKRLLIILGKGKTGTSSLFDYLTKTFDIKYYHGKEIDYWDIYSKLGLDFEWYRLHFSNSENGELKYNWIDASPSYYGNFNQFLKQKNNLDQLNPIYIITKRDRISRIVSLIQHDIRIGKIDFVNNFSDFQKNVLENSFKEKEILKNYLKNDHISDDKWVKSFGEKVNTIENKDLEKSYIDNLFQSFGYSKENEIDFPKKNVSSSKIPLHEDFIKLIRN